MKRLVERKSLLSTNVQLTQVFKQSLGTNWNDSYLSYYGHLVALESDAGEEIILSNLSSHEPILKFLGLLDNINTSDVRQVLMLLSAFYVLESREQLLDILSSEKFHDSSDPVNQLLSDTNGFILYDHQIELLYKVGNKASEKEATEFARNFNKKKLDALENEKKVNVFGKSLLDLINERCVLGISVKPNFSAFQQAMSVFQ